MMSGSYFQVVSKKSVCMSAYKDKYNKMLTIVEF